MEHIAYMKIVKEKTPIKDTLKNNMEQPFEEVAAPLEMGAWNDEALLDVVFLCCGHA